MSWQRAESTATRTRIRNYRPAPGVGARDHSPSRHRQAGRRGRSGRPNSANGGALAKPIKPLHRSKGRISGDFVSRSRSLQAPRARNCAFGDENDKNKIGNDRGRRAADRASGDPKSTIRPIAISGVKMTQLAGRTIGSLPPTWPRTTGQR